MKALLIFFALFSVLGFSQENHNFISENNQVEWQKIFQKDIGYKNVENIIKTKGIFNNLIFTNNTISGTFENITADYKGAGSSGMMTSFYIQNSTLKGKFIIQFKDGKYRTTINSIELKAINNLSGGGISIMSANSVQPLSDFAVKNSGFRKSFLKSDAVIFDYTFSNLFDFTKYTSENNDW